MKTLLYGISSRFEISEEIGKLKMDQYNIAQAEKQREKQIEKRLK